MWSLVAAATVMVLTMSACALLTKEIYMLGVTNVAFLTIVCTSALIPFLLAPSARPWRLEPLYTRLFAAVVVFDVLRTTLSFVSLYLLDPSVYLLLRMQLELCGAALWQRLGLQRVLGFQRLLGLLILSAGAGLFIAPALVHSRDDAADTLALCLGVATTCARALAQTAGSACETHAMQEAGWHPLALTGWQAVGSAASEIVLATLLFFTAPQTLGDLPGRETLAEVNLLIIALAVCYAASCACSQIVQRSTSPLVRNLCKMAVPLLVWAVSLLLLPPRREALHGNDIVFQVTGAVVYLVGAACYFACPRAPSGCGRALLVLGPSGAGKDTLAGMLVERHPLQFRHIPSCTTRAPRPVEHKPMVYLGQCEWDAAVASGDMICNLSELYGNYGIRRSDLVKDSLDERTYVTQDYGEASMRQHFDIRAVIYVTPCAVVDGVSETALRRAVGARVDDRSRDQGTDPLSALEVEQRADGAIEELRRVQGRSDGVLICCNESGHLQEAYACFEAMALAVAGGIETQCAVPA